MATDNEPATEPATESVAQLAAREIVMTRVFDAPPELVFDVWTDPKHVAQWWGPNGFTNTIHEMDVRPGGVWRFIMHGPDGVDYNNRIVFLEVVRPERLVYNHGDPEGEHEEFHVTVTFTEQEGRTRLTMRILFDSAEARNRTVEFGAIEGGKQTLARLGEYLAKMADRNNSSATEPAGEAFVLTRVFDAPRELVFKAWTESERLAQWFGPVGFTLDIRRNEVRPGGIIHYSMLASNGHEMWGRWVYQEISAPERLVFVSSFSDEEGNVARAPFSDTWPLEVLSTVTFSEHEGKTKITMYGIPINATEAERRNFEAMHNSMQGGWTGTLDQLDEYLAKV